MAMQSFSSSFTYAFTYDVFLSFRGEDTRHGFTGNLYKALCDKGIHTFIDDEELQRGDQITSALEKAIQESRIFIIVLSQNYASSSFCLNELDHILKFTKEKFLLVLPVFYQVNPSDIRHHTGSFGEALAYHENKFNANKDTFKCNMDKLEAWKLALHQVANLSGYHYKHGDGYEYEFIHKIVELVSSKINRAPLDVADYPVGLESQVLEVKLLLGIGHDDGVRMVGIHGPGGVGKTTLATAVYNSIADHFEALCFLENVRDTSNKHGLQHLQSSLLSETVGEIKLTSVKQGVSTIQHRLQKKKVLLIIDDVDKHKQLQTLVGGPHWFGPGSRVIITTRDQQLLACHGVKRTYEVNHLNEESALDLLIWNAFKSEKVYPCYKDVLNRAATYASGLPLALEVIGSSLFGRDIEQCRSTLDQYERIPNKEIQEILKVSYDALEEEEQSVFLDLACFFQKCDLAEAKDILRAHHGHCIEHHIGVLVQKSLMKIRYGKVRLHDLIEDMGKEIVRKESPEEPEQRSRLWSPEEIVQVLKENKGTSKIQVIFLWTTEVEIEWNGNAFRTMKNLKTLVIRSGHFSEGPKHLPNTLRVLEWWGYPSDSFPYDFHPKKLAICKLPGSDFRSCELAVFLKQKFVNITNLNFDNCRYLTEIPDVSALPHLENLSFDGCDKLITIHDSVGLSGKLKILSANRCTSLKSLPPMNLPSLEQLSLLFCHSLESFPEILGKMENITELKLEGTIKKFPLSFPNLTRLQSLVLYGTYQSRSGYCDGILFSSMCKMQELVDIKVWGCEGWLWPKEDEGAEKVSSVVASNVQVLHLRHCKLADDFFPTVLQLFANVKELQLPYNNFTVIPECIKECHCLTTLNVHFCDRLQEIRGIPPNLKYFTAHGCQSLNSSSRRLLLNQELHEAGDTDCYFPGAEIPEWFEFQSSRFPISFWFRNKFPHIVICLVIKLVDENSFGPVVFINDNEHWFEGEETVEGDFTYLFHMGVGEYLIDGWNHAEVTYDCSAAPTFIKGGIHVWKQKSIMEDIRFTDPYRKRKSDLHSSESQNQQLLKRQKLDDDINFLNVMLRELDTDNYCLLFCYLALVIIMITIVCYSVT